MNKGRPKTVKPIETLTFNTYKEDITLFRNGLIDSMEDEDNESQMSKDTIYKFL